MGDGYFLCKRDSFDSFVKLQLNIFLFFIFLLPLNALAQGAESHGTHWQQRGLVYRQWQPRLLNTQIYLLKINPQYFRLKPVLAKDYGTQNLTIKSLAEKSKAVALINANFFDPQGKALGLVLKDGKVLNPFHPTKWWAVFLQREQQGKIQSRIAKIFSTKGLKRDETGLQAGPRLVKNGWALKLKNNLSRKSAVGIGQNGALYLLATTGPVAMQDWANFLATPENQGGLGLKEALNLDGGSSTQFYFKRGRQESWLPGLVAVPVGLGVFLK